jgi:nuclear pore complex protein Nup93
MEWSDLASSQLPSLTDEYDNLRSVTGSVVHSNLQPSIGTSIGPIRQQFPVQVLNQQSVFGYNDTRNLLNDMAIEQPAVVPDAPSKTIPDHESLEDSLARLEEEYMNDIITKTIENSTRRVDDIVNKKLQELCKHEQDLFVKEVIGNRYLGGSAGNQQQRHPLQQSNATRSLINAANHDSTEHRLTRAIVSRSLSVQSDNLDTTIALKHLQILVNFIPANIKNTNRTQLMNAVDQFQRAMTETLREQTAVHDIYPTYLSSLKLVAELVSNSTSNANPVDQAKGALTHLSKQFKTHVQDSANYTYTNNSDATTTMFRSSLANQCTIFSKNENGSTSGINNANPWSVVYYCLRCGDAIAALEVLQHPSSMIGNRDMPIVQIVSTLARAQGGSDCFWLVPFPNFNSNDLMAIDNLLDTARQEESPDLYRCGVYSLFARNGQPQTSETVVGFKTIEDYLNTCLFKTFLHDNPITELGKLGHVIAVDFGVDYFHDPSSGGWSFALPLLLTQQYQKALVHLTEDGGVMGLFFAIHIGLILSAANISVTDLGVTEGEVNNDTSVLSTLIVLYANVMSSESVTFGPMKAIEYLVRIPSRYFAQKEVARLIASTLDIDGLVGTLNADGMRENSYLGKFFDSSEMAFTLREAAHILFEDQHDAQKTSCGVMCLMLGERYTDVLATLNQLLSPPNSPDSNRQFWMEQTNLFTSQFLSRTSHVSETLVRTGNANLIEANRLLYDMNMFEHYRSIGMLNDAWTIADKIGIVPTTLQDLPAKQREYQCLHELAKVAVPSFVTGYMDTMYRKFNDLKQYIHSSNSDSVREQLLELQERSRVIIAFASAIALPGDTMGALQSSASLLV